MSQLIAIVNRSTVLTDAQVQAVIPALQTQITRDFAPLWGSDGLLAFAQPNAIPQAAWPIHLFNNADVAQALGYHEDPHGRPDGKVFVETTIAAGLDWTVTLSHELLEILGDASATQDVAYGSKRYAREACDAVEDDQFAYEIDGVKVSDFITLDWFSRAKPGARYDFCGHLTKPRELLIGGYAAVWDRAHGWHQIVCPSGTKQVRLSEFVSRQGTGGRSMRRRA